MRESGVASEAKRSAQGPAGAGSARASAPAPADATLSLVQAGGNQAFLSLLGRTAIQPKLRVGPAGDRYEREADRAAAAIVGAIHGSGDAAASSLSPVAGGVAVQRKCAKCEEEEEETIRRVPRDESPTGTQEGAPEAQEPSAAAQPAPTSELSQQAEPSRGAELSPAEGPETPASETQSQAAAPALLLDDSAEEVGPGQMKKTEFLDSLRPVVCAAVDEGLTGTGRTSDGCPHVEFWFEHLAGKSASFIERGIQRFAPEAKGVQSATGYLTAVASQVLRSTQHWVRTGQLEGVPDELAGAVSGSATPQEAATSGLPRPAIQAKSKAGGAQLPDDPAALRAQLGPGRPLDGGLRARMESVYGATFEDVRFHTDSSGARLADRLHARAFTVGDHVAFGPGEYRPGTILGDALIAHELAHVIQQRGFRDDAEPVKPSSGFDVELERDADRMALGSVTALWSATTSGVARVSRSAVARLRSGLALQRCSKKGPPKLTFSVQGGPTPTDCGGFNWQIGWTVRNASSSTNGVIVQKVEIVRDVKDCANNAVPYTAGQGLNPGWYPMWEAWYVNGGAVTPAVGAVNDIYGQSPLGDRTKGSTSVRGTAEYYDGATLPSSFTVTNAPPAWSLPMTTTQPTIAGGTGPVDHSLTATWDCCRTDKTTSITTSTPP
jgi:hypothetical protein